MVPETMNQPHEAIKSKRPIILAFFLILSLLLGLAAIGFCSYNFVIQKQIEEQQEATLQSNVAKLSHNIDQIADSLGQRQAELQQLEQQQDKSEQWQLQEIYHAIRLADLNLKYGQDPGSALQLLSSVAQELAKVDDPKFDQLRQVLAKDIASIRALQTLDISSILVKLQALSEQILTLPVLNIVPPSQNQAPPSQTTITTHNWWQKSWQQTWQVIQQLVVIRHYDQTSRPLLTQEQQHLLATLIQMHLTQAQWAVLHYNQALFNQSLQQVFKLMQMNYSAGPQKAAFVSSLAELQAINLNLPKPELANTLAAIPMEQNSGPSSPKARPTPSRKQEAALV
jgi:uroporphyrin-3 C-methyltransferase